MHSDDMLHSDDNVEKKQSPVFELGTLDDTNVYSKDHAQQHNQTVPRSKQH